MSVSVIIPVYNREQYVREAIDSVLAQSRSVDDIIVVDDGSTDGSRDVAASFGDAIRYVYQPNGGAGAARNTGIEMAEGDYLAFLDSDDIWSADKTEKQLAAFDSSPDLELVFGRVTQFISPELDDETKRRLDCPSNPMAGYVAGAMIARRRVFDRVGVFDTDVAIGEFIGWFLRVREHALPVRMLSDVVLHRRIHGSNTVITKRDAYSDYVRLLKASLDRRRARSDDS